MSHVDGLCCLLFQLLESVSSMSEIDELIDNNEITLVYIGGCRFYKLSVGLDEKFATERATKRRRTRVCDEDDDDE